MVMMPNDSERDDARADREPARCPAATELFSSSGIWPRSIIHAEELAQDVFLKVHKGLPYFRGESKLSTWIYRIVVNVLSQERPDLATASLDDTGDDDRPKHQPGAEDRAFGDFVLKDRLQKAIERLPISIRCWSTATI